jgi:hypothetical protein
MSKQNPFNLRPTLLWIITPLVVTFSIAMFMSFYYDGLTFGGMIFLMVIVAVAIGMIIATVFPKKGRWGIKIVTFIISGAYLWYMIDQFIFTAGRIDPTVRQSTPSPFNALLGFLVIGIPCLLYTFAGSSLDKMYEDKSDNISTRDIVVAYIIRGVKWLIFILNAVAITAVIIKLF